MLAGAMNNDTLQFGYCVKITNTLGDSEHILYTGEVMK